MENNDMARKSLSLDSVQFTHVNTYPTVMLADVSITVDELLAFAERTNLAERLGYESNEKMFRSLGDADKETTLEQAAYWAVYRGRIEAFCSIEKSGEMALNLAHTYTGFVSGVELNEAEKRLLRSRYTEEMFEQALSWKDMSLSDAAFPYPASATDNESSFSLDVTLDKIDFMKAAIRSGIAKDKGYDTLHEFFLAITDEADFPDGFYPDGFGLGDCTNVVMKNDYLITEAVFGEDKSVSIDVIDTASMKHYNVELNEAESKALTERYAKSRGIKKETSEIDLD